MKHINLIANLESLHILIKHAISKRFVDTEESKTNNDKRRDLCNYNLIDELEDSVF